MSDNEHRESGWVYDVVFSDLGMCGCGMFDERLILLKEVLNACPLWDRENVPDYLNTALGEWFLCIINKARLIEHGGSIGGSWLTDKGHRLLEALNDEHIWEEFLADDVGFCECSDCKPLWDK